MTKETIEWDDAAIPAMKTLEERDKYLEELWGFFEDVPIDPETERIEEGFLGFPPGTDREDIWHWFDERHSRGVAYLLYGDGVDRTPVFAELAYYQALCPECDTRDCAFWNGVCRMPMIAGKKPFITDDDGCKNYMKGENA